MTVYLDLSLTAKRFKDYDGPNQVKKEVDQDGSRPTVLRTIDNLNSRNRPLKATRLDMTFLSNMSQSACQKSSKPKRFF